MESREAEFAVGCGKAGGSGVQERRLGRQADPVLSRDLFQLTFTACSDRAARLRAFARACRAGPGRVERILEILSHPAWASVGDRGARPEGFRNRCAVGRRRLRAGRRRVERVSASVSAPGVDVCRQLSGFWELSRAGGRGAVGVLKAAAALTCRLTCGGSGPVKPSRRQTSPYLLAGRRAVRAPLRGG